MTVPTTFAPSERIIVEWLRTETDALSETLLDESGYWRIATRLPAPLRLPFVVVQALPGGGSTGEAPINETLVQFDAYAGNQQDLHQGDLEPEREDGPHYQPDLIASQDLATLIYGLAHAVRQHNNSKGTLYGIDTSFGGEPFRIPEEDLGLARFSFTGLVVTRSN